MHNNQQGFTLVEWLTGLGIGMFVLTFVYQLYFHAYKVNHAILGTYEMRSDARVALYFLAYDIRMAGFIGCPNLSEITLPESSYQLPHALIGNYESTLVSLPRQLKNSDRLYLQYADPKPQSIISAQKSTVRFQHNPHFSPNTVLVISDCKHAEVFQLANVQLKHQYKEDATVRRFYRIVYYIASTNRKNSARKPIYALYRKDLNTAQQPTELVENIIKLTLRYGVLNHSKIDYLTAEKVMDWNTIRSVEVTTHASPPHMLYNTAPPSFSLKQVIMIRSRATHYPK